MGIIRAGILSKVSGKVAGVVGGSWKDRAYLREYVIPANPNTTPQQVQRGKMSVGVQFAKSLVGQVFNKYTDKFERGMSGFNRFIKDNMALFVAPIGFATVKMTNGKLWGAVDSTLTSAAHKLDWAVNPGDFGNNGAASDKMYCVGYDTTTGLWYFAAAETTRGTGAISITCPVAAVGHVFWSYIWCAKYSATSPTLLEMISDSKAATIVLA